MADRLDIFGNRIGKNEFGDSTVATISNEFGDRRVSPTDENILLSRDEQLPSDMIEDPNKFRNAYFYSRNLGVPVEQAYEYEDGINRVLYGEGTSSASAWKENKRRLMTGRRKGLMDALKHGGINAENLMRKSIAGLGRMIAETEVAIPNVHSVFAAMEPALKWMWDLPNDFNLNEALIQASDWVSQDIKDYQREHPESGYAIDPDIGFKLLNP